MLHLSLFRYILPQLYIKTILTYQTRTHCTSFMHRFFSQHCSNAFAMVFVKFSFKVGRFQFKVCANIYIEGIHTSPGNIKPHALCCLFKPLAVHLFMRVYSTQRIATQRMQKNNILLLSNNNTVKIIQRIISIWVVRPASH